MSTSVSDYVCLHGLYCPLMRRGYMDMSDRYDMHKRPNVTPRREIKKFYKIYIKSKTTEFDSLYVFLLIHTNQIIKTK